MSERRFFCQVAQPAAAAANLPVELAAVLRRLDVDPHAVGEQAGDDRPRFPRKDRLQLAALAELGLVEELLTDEHGAVLARVSRPRVPIHEPAGDDDRFELCPHTFLLPQRGGWQIATPSSGTLLWTNDASLIDLIARASNQPLVLEPDDPQRTAIGLLIDQGFLRPVREPAGDRIPWSFHDALFHGASAFGHAVSGGYGATFPFRGVAVSPPDGDVRDDDIGLPCLDRAASPAVGLDAVFAERHSTRAFSATPIDAGTLGALLELSMRVRRTIETAGETLFGHAFPSGGARGEITSMLIAERCDGLAPGFYEYRKHGHALRVIHLHEGGAHQALRILSASTGETRHTASAALVFAASYERMASKYECIAYATILRNVGCIYQTVSLSASCLGLGSCVLGGGWGALQESTLASWLAGRVIVGAVLLGWPQPDG